MLVQLENPQAAAATLPGNEAYNYTFRCFCNFDGEPDDRAMVLGDDPLKPSVLVAHQHGDMMAAGNPARYEQALGDILHHRVEQDPPWPTERTTTDWGELPKRKGFFLHSCPLAFWEAGKAAGFEVHPDDHVEAYLWCIAGKPRFADLVRHPCRLGQGEELLELLIKGIGYDPDGTYIRHCLKRGPSFVCEAGGEPVCWSATHVNGTMAMIYTPEEHRRRGYAKSLTAFQVDHMLKLRGIACCHIVSTNEASNELVKAFGFKRDDDPVVWRVLYWPG